MISLKEKNTSQTTCFSIFCFILINNSICSAAENRPSIEIQTEPLELTKEQIDEQKKDLDWRNEFIKIDHENEFDTLKRQITSLSLEDQQIQKQNRYEALCKIKAEKDSRIEAQKHYNAQKSSWFHNITSWILKAIITTFFTALITEFIEWCKQKFSPALKIRNLEKDSQIILEPYMNNDRLLLTKTQEEFNSAIFQGFEEYLLKGEKRFGELPLILYVGTAGAGKTASILGIMAKIMELEEERKPVSLAREVINTILPDFLLSMCNVAFNSYGSYLVMSGSYFYNFGNEQEKAVSFFESMLRLLMKRVYNSPDKFVIVAIDEIDQLFNSPLFVHAFKIILTEVAKMNEDKNHGYMVIMGTTNYAEMSDPAISRRAQLIHFDAPRGSTKLETFIMYLEKNLKKNQYTTLIVSRSNSWLQFCSEFSHSDIKNLIWSLKLEYATTGIQINFLRLLEKLLIEIKKREILVYNNRTTHQLSLKLPEIEILINKIKKYSHTFLDNLIEDHNLDSKIDKAIFALTLN